MLGYIAVMPEARALGVFDKPELLLKEPLDGVVVESRVSENLKLARLALDLADWPEEIRPSPLRGRDGRLIAGDPVLIGASSAGLLFAPDSSSRDPVLVEWRQVRSARVLGREQASA